MKRLLFLVLLLCLGCQSERQALKVQAITTYTPEVRGMAVASYEMEVR